MTRPARFTPRARAEVREAAAWIAKNNQIAAGAFRAAVIATAQLIGEHPLVGVARPEIVRRPYRTCVVSGFPYLVVYDRTPTRPVIARVVYGTRDLPGVLRGL